MEGCADISIPTLQVRKLRLRLADSLKLPQLLSGRVGCEPVCSTQTVVLLHNGDLLARVPGCHLSSGCNFTFTVTHRDMAPLVWCSSGWPLPPTLISLPVRQSPGSPQPRAASAGLCWRPLFQEWGQHSPTLILARGLQEVQPSRGRVGIGRRALKSQVGHPSNGPIPG